MRYALLIFMILTIVGCNKPDIKLDGVNFIECPGHERIIGDDIVIEHGEKVIIHYVTAQGGIKTQGLIIEPSNCIISK